MIHIYDFTWHMVINFDFICSCIENNTYRKKGLKVAQIRKLYKLICQYADSTAEQELNRILASHPKAFTFLLKERRIK